MVPKTLLDRAKAFLCWDVFSDLAVQLVPLQQAVAYYYPPGGGLHSIVVFYDPGPGDYSEPLFLLFHEAGHVCQWRQLREAGREKHFLRLLSLDAGPEKAAFEREAWRLGAELFVRFAGSCGLTPALQGRLESYGLQCIRSYDHP